MFRLMRNIHLGLGLSFIVISLVFALSSLFSIYRPWLPDERDEAERTVAVAAQDASTPQALAQALMRDLGLKGDVAAVAETDDGFRFRIHRPGVEHNVEYSRMKGEAKILDRRYGLGQTLMQLHTNHGLWHDFLPSNLWAALSLLGSIGLLLLGASGIYLWFSHHDERFVGAILLTMGLVYGITSLVLTRTAG